MPVTERTWHSWGGVRRTLTFKTEYLGRNQDSGPRAVGLQPRPSLASLRFDCFICEKGVQTAPSDDEGVACVHGPSGPSLAQRRRALTFHLQKLLISVCSMKPFPSLNIPLLEVPETQTQRSLLYFICSLFCKSCLVVQSAYIGNSQQTETYKTHSCLFTFDTFVWFLYPILHPSHLDLDSGRLIS